MYGTPQKISDIHYPQTKTWSQICDSGKGKKQETKVICKGALGRPWNSKLDPISKPCGLT